jgi:hypothetical protein
MQVPIAITKQAQIKAAIDAVDRQLRPDVVHIRYEIGQDWSGQWAIFFKVLLSDEASIDRNLREMAPKFVWSVSDRLDLPELGLFPHFDFRSQSEQIERNEPAWA